MEDKPARDIKKRPVIQEESQGNVAQTPNEEGIFRKGKWSSLLNVVQYFCKMKTDNSALDLVIWSSIHHDKSCFHAVERENFG